MNILMNFLGGVALLLLGMQMAGEGLQKAAGARLRSILNTLTTNRFSGLLVGTVMTAIMQSSGATTVLLVSFVGSGLLAFEQTIAVILGANIGTTFTVQLIAFRLTDYALLLVALGFLIASFSKGGARHLGRAVLGFGLIFLAIRIFGETMAPLKDNPFVAQVLTAIGQDLWLGIMTGAVVTALMNSSAATIGIAIVMAHHGLMPLSAAIPIVLGANIGTCALSMFSSFGAPLEARRVATAHGLIKTIGVLLMVPIVGPFIHFISLSAPDVARQIANGHTAFNFLLSLLFLPLATPFARLIKRLLPANPNEEVGFQIRYLDERILGSPILALGAANREVRRMADRVQVMISEVMELFLKGNEEVLDHIEKLETELDSLTKAIINYLSSLSQNALTEEESRRASAILYIVNDLEHIGDMLTKMSLLGKKKIEMALVFSEQGIAELIEMHDKVATNLDMAIVSFMTSDRQLAEKVMETKPKIARLERDLRAAHLSRLWAGQQFSRQTSTIHLDLINGWQRINDHAVNIAQAVLES
ncbi:MAG TPA: Na/Pi cotransporter family protein [Chroococcales cyanobacterium]